MIYFSMGKNPRKVIANIHCIFQLLRGLCAKALVMTILGFCCTSMQGQAEPLPEQNDALLAKIIEAYGGRERLAGVVSVSAEGRIKKYLPEDEGDYFRHMKRERKLLVEIRYRHSSETRILNRTKGYRGVGGKTKPVQGPPYIAMVYQYNQTDLPFGFLDGSFRVLSREKGSVNGAEIEILMLEDNYRNKLEVHIDPKDFLILKVIGYFKVGRNRTSLAAEFSDFRKVEGILFPFRIVNFARNNRLSETTITKYSLNPDFNESRFRTD